MILFFIACAKCLQMFVKKIFSKKSIDKRGGMVYNKGTKKERGNNNEI